MRNFKNSLPRSKRGLAAIATVALLAAPLSACGSEDSSSSSSSSSSSAPKPVAAIDALTGSDTQITLDQGFVDALTQLKLTPGVVGDATLTDGALDFPITGGNVTVFTPGEVSPYVIGQIQHENSGLSLTAGDTTVELTNFNVDPGVSRVYGDVAVNGKTAVTNAFLFQLDGRTLKPLATEGDTAVLEGTEVKISDVAAPLLNDTFKTDAVAAGLLVGIAKITVNTK
ncbi:hypothetical protein [Nocardioides lianchengensis]|uniref:Uncharacterized protein n=1 Tax=Nocardioides lianchengensis TaxID=1045774 RepID=A0A1G6XBC6_9ACTN|nr:hypothetical protein [Nocardioides lianchengensis]NYG09025.1 hypothetical protein [Nocardioides lianchengensis]SDD75480.1 hypothetical protein SAMN05421872_110234 [Nocardioides lianchengensis]